MSAGNSTKAAVVKLMKFLMSQNAASNAPFDAAHKFTAASSFNSVLQKVKFVDGDIGTWEMYS